MPAGRFGPEPPGSGLQIRPREPYSPHLPVCLRKASFLDEMVANINLTETLREECCCQDAGTTIGACGEALTRSPALNVGIYPTMTVFRWQRFWVPRTASIDLSDGGFLVDPTLPFATTLIGPRQLAELSGYRAIVLLGEPGIGKSTTLSEEAERLGNQAAEGTMSIRADLRAYSSEYFLHERVFESTEFMAMAERKFASRSAS